MKRKTRNILIIAAVLAAVGVGTAFFSGVFHGSNASTQAGLAAASSTVAVSRGAITTTVTASGQLEPSITVTIRPDSNMPTRKVTKVFVSAGQRVTANQVLAEIDATGLDLTLKSAEANYQAQKAKLDNLEAKPADMDLKAAEAALTAARVAMESAQADYDGAKVLADNELVSKSSLAQDVRALASATAAWQSQVLSYQNVQAQSAVADVKAQEAVVATADYDRQMAKIVLDSAVIRSPSAGVVAEVLVGVGDLVSPTTTVAYVVDTDPMLLIASVNENDMPSLKAGQPVSVTQTAYPDDVFSGVVKGIDLHASTSNSVSTFAVTIQVANTGGKLLWGMNADAQISVVSLKDVLVLPSSAIKTTNGTSTVTVIDKGSPVTSAVTVGATDGTRTQILSGLAEGQQVVSKSSKTAATTASAPLARATGVSGLGSLLGGGAGGPPPGP
jgi:multidrug resistance efflux pump